MMLHQLVQRFSTLTRTNRIPWSTKVAALQHFKQAFGHLNVPQSFQFGGEWPEHFQHVHLGSIVNRLRAAKREKLLTPEQEAELASMGFDMMVRISWSDKILALNTFREIFGHVNVPIAFEIPQEDARWPSKIHGMKLGNVVKSLRFRHSSLSKQRRDALDAIGFVWSSWESSWHKRFQALSTYRSIHGDLHVPSYFVVPENDELWPKDFWGMKLHVVVQNMRYRSHRLTFEQINALNEIGFVWDNVDHSFETRANAWKLYESKHGTKDVPYEFVVPSGASWPKAMWELPLGRVVRTIVDKPSRLSLDQLAYLYHLKLLARGHIDVIG
ncbi:hypothetical protein LEN26_016231 [Aphanomyces euteiches]|nr:hypothetical protein LEN26_016231 [Aphanomyces euteiches]KAH9115800.1 hypothetical protein AeMF1_010179 [Aphanomyces euteiches]KAH9194090.1 hypothetical protein AeNC1_003941 [Aphanomyces euteiches]